MSRTGAIIFALRYNKTVRVARLAELEITEHRPIRLSFHPYLDQDYYVWLQRRRDDQKVSGAETAGDLAQTGRALPLLRTALCCRTRRSNWWSLFWAGGVPSPIWPTSTGAAPMMWSSRARREAPPVWMCSLCWMESRSLFVGWRTLLGPAGVLPAVQAAIGYADARRNRNDHRL